MAGNMLEIRFHGRGGQGAVTSAELLAQAAISEGKYAQAFPSFGPERRGAPVQAFNRVSQDRHIRLRAEVTEPDVVVVLDPGLLQVVDVNSGLKENGITVINTSKTIQDIRKKLTDSKRVATVDATQIARDILGVPITNTTMLGALVRVTGAVDIESLIEPLKHRFGRLAERNIKAMRTAFAQTRIEGE